MNEIHVAGIAGEEIAVGKQRIKGLEPIVVRVAIPGRRVDAQTEMRRPAGIGKGIADDRTERPCVDGLAADSARLVHRLDIPVEAVRRTFEPDVDNLPAFVAAGAREMRGPPTIVKVVDGHLRGPHDGPPYQDAGSRQPAITVVVERPAVANLDWLTIESAQPPTTASVDHQGCVVRLTQIGSVAHRQEPLQIDVNELAPRSQRERATTERVGDPDEGLLHIEPVLINRRAHGLARRICTLNLREDLDVLPEPKVGVRFQSAEQPLSLVRWRRCRKTRRGWSRSVPAR